ncbi:hypothetical protein [Actinosynnema sp. NPDC023587]
MPGVRAVQEALREAGTLSPQGRVTRVEDVGQVGPGLAADVRR